MLSLPSRGRAAIKSMAGGWFLDAARENLWQRRGEAVWDGGWCTELSFLTTQAATQTSLCRELPDHTAMTRNLTVPGPLARPLPQAKPKASVRRVVSMSHAVKIYDTCIGCTQCVRACPTDVLEMVPWNGCKAGQIASAPRTEDCVGCKRCESACPTDFLSVRVYLGAETTRSMGLAY